MRTIDLLRMAGRAVKEALRKKGEMIMLSVGDQAPDFEVENDREQRVRLADQRGKTIVLWFYPKADTPG